MSPTIFPSDSNSNTGKQIMNGAAVFLVAFFTSIATSIGTLYLSERLDIFEHSTPKEQTVQVPKLVGLLEFDAASNLTNSDLVLLIGGREPSSTAAEGTVLHQSVPAGQKIPKGQGITVTLATATPKVPSVIGKTLEEATQLLKDAGFPVKDEPIHDEALAEGQIISQSHEAGTNLEKGQTVIVTVSKGPGPLEVPNLIGFHYATAKSTLQEMGLEVKLRWVDLAETPSSIVLSQKPKAGKVLSKGADVEIVVNRE